MIGIHFERGRHDATTKYGTVLCCTVLYRTVPYCAVRYFNAPMPNSTARSSSLCNLLRMTSPSSVEDAPSGMFFARRLFESIVEVKVEGWQLLLSPQSLNRRVCNSPSMSFVLEH